MLAPRPLIGLLLLFVSMGVSHAQQLGPAPDEALTRCQGELHAAIRATAGAQQSSGEIAVELRRVQTQLTQAQQERDALKKQVEALEKAAGTPPTH